MSNKPPREEPIELEPVDMHAPVEIKVSVHLKLDDGRSAVMDFLMPSGRIPTRQEIVAAVQATMSTDGAGEPGYRLMDKTEFVKHITMRDAGVALVLPGNKDFVPSAVDVPHSMLVHAIAGASFEFSNEGFALAKTFEDRGLLRSSTSGHGGCDSSHYWDRRALMALADDELLAIYQRVTA
jgi:hypothetical protein